MSRTYDPHPTPAFTLAPSIEDVEALAAEALARIPETFRRHVGNVRIHIDDFPSEEIERQMRLESPFDLLGLYQGLSLAEKGSADIANDIDRIFLYRRPILDYWVESGHHFGLSDADMEAIEAQAEADAHGNPARGS
jgi:predicted Zn-dependent protease with MMP-like domain